MQSKRTNTLIGCGLFFGLITSILVALFLVNSFVYIGPTERGVVLSLFEPGGVREEVLTPGRHWVWFWDDVKVYNVAKQIYSTSDNSQTSNPIEITTYDNQRILVNVLIEYVINPVEILSMHIHWQNRYQIELVRPLVRGVTRDITSQYPAWVIGTLRRAEIEQKIFTELNEKFSQNHLILLNFTITEIQPVN